jgi:sugar phosphate isomerase/epimerase
MTTQHRSSRRSFITHLAAGAALATTVRHASQVQAAAGPSNMRFGLVTYLWGEHLDLPTLIDTCQKSGLKGVELRTEHKHGVEPSLSAEQRDEVRQRFADSGITLVGYGSNAEFHSNDPAELKANIERAKEYVRLMHDCGGGGVKVKPNAFVKDVPHEKTIEQIGKALNEIAEYAEGFGQEIRVEVHGKGTKELPVIRDIFKIATHHNVGVCWNSNAEDLHGEGLEANFNMVKARFGSTCHVRELDDKGYPYSALFKLFRAIDYEGWILLEAHTKPSDVVAALTAQKALFDQLNA